VLQAFVKKIHGMTNGLMMVPDGDSLRTSGNLAEFKDKQDKQQDNPLSTDSEQNSESDALSTE
jgi:hypothetical protein